jgi:transforming growth factor-beta-induced protein
MKDLHHKFQKSMRVTLVLTLMLLIATACDKEEAYVEPQEDLPDFITALENFDEEVEYGELASPEARFGSYYFKRKWKKRPTYLTLVSALNYTRLFSTVVRNEVTVFAPDDEAFAKLGLHFWNIRKLDKDVLTDILLYHTAEGFIFARDLPDCAQDMLNGSAIGFNFMDEKVLIKDASNEFAQVVYTDRKALNTVWHGIDKVLTPPDKTIAEIAVSDDRFSTLVSLLQAAGLDGVVADPNQSLTVFAPTNTAFDELIKFVADNLGFDLVAYLTKYPEELDKVLKHHVAGGSTFSFCLENGDMIPTLNADEITVDFSDATMPKLISSNGTPVGLIGDLLDIHANNGVIHAIDFVLLPSNLDLTKPL